MEGKFYVLLLVCLYAGVSRAVTTDFFRAEVNNDTAAQNRGQFSAVDYLKGSPAVMGSASLNNTSGFVVVGLCKQERQAGARIDANGEIATAVSPLSNPLVRMNSAIVKTKRQAPFQPPRI